MPLMKITDVRVRTTPTANQVHVVIDGLGSQDDLLLELSPERASVMLGVFNARRDCFWETGGRTFLTDPNPTAAPSPALTAGVVGGWEVRIPWTGQIEFRLSIIGPPPQPSASGNIAAAWVTVKANQDLAPLILDILLSKYVHYDNGNLRNAHHTLVG